MTDEVGGMDPFDVVLDEDFVRSAMLTEPSARDRLAAVAEAPAAATRRVSPARDRRRGDPGRRSVGELRDRRRRIRHAVIAALLILLVVGLIVAQVLESALFRHGSSGGNPPTTPRTRTVSAAV